MDDKERLEGLLERENQGRMKAGTLVVAIAPFTAETPDDLNFEAGEELQIIGPIEEQLGWYEAKRCYSNGQSKMEGTIPITHVRPVYDDDSDPEDEPSDIDNEPQPIHDDITDFLTNSGWFSCIGKPHGKEALYYVLAKKCRMEYKQFMSIKKAIYLFDFMGNEKIYIGKAAVLHATLAEHFECFGKPRASIRAIDDELCHHSVASNWQLQIWPLADSDNLEVEWAKKICHNKSLQDDNDESGLNESIKFTHKTNWAEFKNWLNPNRS